MTEVASADFVLRSFGMNDVERALTQFDRKIDRSMAMATKATEKATKATKLQILGFAALGAAVGVVFIDFLRRSTVLSTMTSTLGIIFGAMADRILVKLMPAFKKLIPVLLDFSDKVAVVSGRILDDLVPALDKAIFAAGEVGEAFNTLDDDTQDLTVSIGALIAGFALIASGRPVLGAGAVITAFALNLEGITQTVNESAAQLQNWAHVIQQIPAGLSAEFALEFGRIAGFFNDLAHQFQLLGIGLAFEAAVMVMDVQDAWGGLVRFFEDLWRSLAGGAETAWGSFAAVMTGAWDVVVGSFRVFVNAMAGLLVGFINPFVAGMNAIASAINTVVGIIPGISAIPLLPELTIPTLEGGGTVIQTGAAIVHKGETVFAAGSAPITLTITNHFAFGGGVPAGLADLGSEDAFRRMLDEHSRKDAERLTTILRRRQ